MDETKIRQIIRDELSNIFKIDRILLDKNIQILDSRNIQLGTTNGTQIGTAIGQKLAFYGGTPVDQPATITDPTGGTTTDSQARTAINTLIDRLQELFLIA